MTSRSLLRTGAIVIVGQVSVALIGIVGLRVFTGLVPPTIFGEANLLLAALTLGMQIFIAPFTASQLRFFSQAQARGAGNRFTHDALRWSLLAALLLGLAMLVGLPVWQQVSGDPPQMLAGLAALLWTLGTAARNVLMNRLQAEQRQTTYALLQVLEALLTLAFTAALLRASATLGAYIGGQALAVLGLALLLRLARATPPAGDEPPSEFLGKVRGYGLAFIPMSILTFLANLADRYTVGVLLGAAAVGQYVAPFAIASRGMTLLGTGLNDLFRPMLFDAENRRDPTTASRIFLQWMVASAGVGLIGLLVIYLLGAFITSLLLAPAYRAAAVGVMLWVGGGYAVYGLNQIFETRLLSLGRSARLLPSMALGAAANLAFSFLLVPRNGVLGAAQASCSSFIMQTLASATLLAMVLRQARGAPLRAVA